MRTYSQQTNRNLLVMNPAFQKQRLKWLNMNEDMRFIARKYTFCYILSNIYICQKRRIGKNQCGVY